MKNELILTALLGAVAIALGALGAHALESKLTLAQLNSWDTAVKYQMYHVLACLILILSAQSLNVQVPVRLFLTGIFLFSGSIYLLSLKDVLHLGSFTKILGPITPIGGLCFIIGWVLLAVQFYKN